MGIDQAGGKMEGWLYLIRFNRFGLQYSRKRYFILEDNCLKNFKSKPMSDKEEPIRSALIDSCIRVTDNGRESFHRKVFFIFTVYNISDHNDQLKFGASRPEEAARWIRSLQDAAVRPQKNLASCSRKWQPFRLTVSKRTSRKHSVDWTSTSSMRMDAMTSDVIAPSPWKIFGCQNGLRLFKEARDGDFSGKDLDDHPAIMAVGVVDGSSEAVFSTLMSLGSSRSEWDFCFHHASVVEHLDGHTDIIHENLSIHWLPWGMKRRDLLVRRYWRREDDGTYVILFHSVYHRKCPPQDRYVRACVKSLCATYKIVVSFQAPIRCRICHHSCEPRKGSVVKHMLAVDWKFWKSYIRRVSARSITIRMLGRVAALRELFKAKAGNGSFEFPSIELTRDIGLHQSGHDIETGVNNLPIEKVEEETEKAVSGCASILGLNDAADEFFDVPEPSDEELLENDWSSGLSPELHYAVRNSTQQKLLPTTWGRALRIELTRKLHSSPDTSYDLCLQEVNQPIQCSAASFVKKLHNLAVQKKGYVELQEVVEENNVLCCYGATLTKDPSCNSACSWTTADPSSFLIRGASYLQDRQRHRIIHSVNVTSNPFIILNNSSSSNQIKAKSTLMQLVAADWLKSDKREDDISSRPGGIVQKYAAQGGHQFFFVVNIQVPGTTTYGLVLYFMTESPLEENPLLEHFVNGDDAHRNSRFKLIPYISKLEVDVGSSQVARGVCNLVLGYLNNLVIELAFLIQANTEEELPECLLGTCRLNHLDASKAVVVTL
ncbi:unnamed protein product [Thlaspi arvense]|uniref:Uncharacterized protein n=1 Tax=Thlaspi arvense TaxID=13288 RepID=A0AAU9RSN1_THLAR|nr:unnamed protein product [Thlaspi arvense]